MNNNNIPSSAQHPHPPEWDLLLSAAQKNLPDKIREMVASAPPSEGGASGIMGPSGVDPNHGNAVGQSALHIASLWGHVECVEALLAGGADPNIRNRLMGSTPLHMATSSSKASSLDNILAVVELLVEYGADVSLADDYGSLPIHALTRLGITETMATSDDPIANQLIAKLQPKAPPIFVAVETLDVDQVRQILVLQDEEDDADGGAAVAAANSEYMGQTPVIATVDKLLAIADEDADGDKDKKASSAAIIYENDVPRILCLLKLLLEKGGKPNGNGNSVAESSPNNIGEESSAPPLQKVLETIRQQYKQQQQQQNDDSAIATALEEAACMLHEKGAVITPESIQLLHQSARFNELRLAKFLIDRLRIDPNIRGRQNMTPLQFACRSGQIDMLNYLLSLPDIDVQAKDGRGQTAMGAARANNKQDVLTVLQEYIDANTNNSGAGTSTTTSEEEEEEEKEESAAS